MKKDLVVASTEIVAKDLLAAAEQIVASELSSSGARVTVTSYLGRKRKRRFSAISADAMFVDRMAVTWTF